MSGSKAGTGAADAGFRRLADELPILIWMAGTDALCNYFNQGWLDFRGRTSEQEQGNGWAEGVHPEDFDRCQKTYLDAFHARRSFEMEYRLKRADGEFRWIYDRGVPLWGPNGAFTGYLGACMDVTHRREAEVAIRRLNGDLERLVEERTRELREKASRLAEAERIARLGSWDWDVADDRIRWSDGLCRIYGVDPATFRASYAEFLQRIHPEDRERVQEVVQHAYRTGEDFEVDHRIVLPDGRVRVLHGRGRVAMGPDGRPARMTGTAHDVTEERARTAQLEASNRELETFTYTVAHDLRAPLRSMHRYCDLLLLEKGDRLDDEGRDWTRRIAQGALKMDRLIEDLLAYSRIGQSRLARSPLELSAAVTEALSRIDDHVKERRAEVRVEPDLPPVLGDSLLVGQVLVNLLSNAIKFVPADRAPVVRVKARRHEGRVRLEIEDNGIGIEPRHRDRLFRIFERLHGPEAYPGTGIGLAIVKKAVQHLGGHVDFEPAEPNGTRFFVELPSP